MPHCSAPTHGMCALPVSHSSGRPFHWAGVACAARSLCRSPRQGCLREYSGLATLCPFPVRVADFIATRCDLLLPRSAAGLRVHLLRQMLTLRTPKSLWLAASLLARSGLRRLPLALAATWDTAVSAVSVLVLCTACLRLVWCYPTKSSSLLVWGCLARLLSAICVRPI